MSNLYTELLRIQDLGLTAKRDTEAYNYKYADLDQIWSLLRPELKKSKLLVIQSPSDSALVTQVIDIDSGDSVESRTALLTPSESKNHMQDLGAAITYARRYALATMFNIIVNDDDAASATKDAPVSKAASPTAKPSDKQIALISDLLRQMGFSQDKIFNRTLEIKDAKEASELIGKLMEAPKVNK